MSSPCQRDTDLLEQLRAMERENTDQGPRVVLYFPHELHLEHSR